MKTDIAVYLAMGKDNKIKRAVRLQLEDYIFICEELLSTNEEADLQPDKVENMREKCTHYLLWLHNHYGADGADQG
jgi:hypothetical protein